jgi:hypothetical protein
MGRHPKVHRAATRFRAARQLLQLTDLIRVVGHLPCGAPPRSGASSRPQGDQRLRSYAIFRERHAWLSDDRIVDSEPARKITDGRAISCPAAFLIERGNYIRRAGRRAKSSRHRSEHRTEDVVPETGAPRRLRQAAAPPPPAITIHPNASEIYRRKIAELAAALASPNIRGQAAKRSVT